MIEIVYEKAEETTENQQIGGGGIGVNNLTGSNKLLNVDINGAFNIIKKVISDVFDLGIKGSTSITD